MTILLVDDEHYILDGLRLLIEKNFGGHQVYLCDSGAAAARLAERVTPDIVISDINMNEMNGLDFIARLRKTHPETRVLIISGYDDFSYARRAIDLDITSYILKPINQANLVDILQRTIGEIEARNSRQAAALMNEQDARKKVLLDLVKYGFRETDISGQVNRLGLAAIFDRYYVGALAIDNYHLISKMDHSSQFANLHRHIENIIEAQVEKTAPEAILHAETAPGEYLFVFGGGKAGLKNLLAAIAAQLESELNLRAGYSVSPGQSGYPRLFYGYCLAKGFAMAPAPGQDPGEELAQFILGARKKLGELTQANDLEGLSTEWGFLLGYLSARYPMARAAVEFCGSEYARLVAHITQRYELEPLELPPIPHDARDIPRLMPQCLQLKDRLDRLRAERSAMLLDDLVDRAREMVQRQVQSATLNTVAEALGISYVYLSIIFKERTGENFKDYALRVKMDAARHLLRDTDEKVYAIADRVGYTDIKYFSRLFKSCTGMTPAEYRSQTALV